MEEKKSSKLSEIRATAFDAAAIMRQIGTPEVLESLTNVKETASKINEIIQGLQTPEMIKNIENFRIISENIDSADVFAALTNAEEANILSAMLAKRLGARKVMALINRPAYAEMMEGGSIVIALSPQTITIRALLAYVRRGDVSKVHSLRRGAAEAIETVAHGDERTSRVVGRRRSQFNATQPTAKMARAVGKIASGAVKKEASACQLTCQVGGQVSVNDEDLSNPVHQPSPAYLQNADAFGLPGPFVHVSGQHYPCTSS